MKNKLPLLNPNSILMSHRNGSTLFPRTQHLSPWHQIIKSSHAGQLSKPPKPPTNNPQSPYHHTTLTLGSHQFTYYYSNTDMPTIRLAASASRQINAVVVSAGLMQKTVKARIGTQKFNKFIGKVCICLAFWPFYALFPPFFFTLSFQRRKGSIEDGLMG